MAVAIGYCIVNYRSIVVTTRAFRAGASAYTDYYSPLQTITVSPRTMAQASRKSGRARRTARRPRLRAAGC